MLGNPRNPVEEKICELEKGLLETKKQISELRKDLPPEEVKDYELTDLNGKKITFLSLFAGHNELLLVHNMGPQCPYCTLWADGFRTLKPYFNSRCSFVLETDRFHEEIKKIKEERSWDFDVVSSFETTLKKDLGFQDEKMNFPGVSSFYKEDGKIFRHATAPFGPGDDFCSIWGLLSLLKDQSIEWQPKYNL
jgi:predicted dithiol-disulfide oxidoreductase (DUF899 family)